MKLIKTIKDYTDRETKQIFRVSDVSTIREVSDARAEELIKKGVAVEYVLPTEDKKAKKPASKKDSKKEQETTSEESTDASADEFASDSK